MTLQRWLTFSFLTFLALGGRNASADLIYVNQGGTGEVSTVTPDGVVHPFADGLNGPRGMALDGGGGLVVADLTGASLSKVDASGNVSPFVSSGLSSPFDIVRDAAGDYYVSDYGLGSVLKVTASGAVSTLASGFVSPSGLAIDASGDLWLADHQTGEVYRISADGSTVTPFWNGGSGIEGIAFDTAGNLLVVQGYQGEILIVTPDGSGSHFASLPYVVSVGFDSAGQLYAVTETASGGIYKISADGQTITPFVTGLSYPTFLAFGPSAAVPEPPSARLAIAGLAGITSMAWRRRRSRS